MKYGLLITMYNESPQVAVTCNKVGAQVGKIFVAKSCDDIENWIDPVLLKVCAEHDNIFFEPLENFEPMYSRWELPPQSISRNYSHLFKQARTISDVDYWIACTGDTVIVHLLGIDGIVEQMRAENKIVAVSKAVGMDLLAADNTLEDINKNKGKRRIQGLDISDFQPQLFIVDGRAVQEGLFCHIPITNRWSSEQCLGDAVGMNGQYVFSTTAYGFMDGIIYQAIAQQIRQ